MKKLLLATTFISLSLHAGESKVNDFPNYYKDIEPVILKDTMLGYFGTTSTSIVSYGLEDVAKVSGHVCPAVTGAFLMTRESLNALANHYRENPNSDGVTSFDAESGLIYRGGVKVTMSGQKDIGNGANAMGSVMSYITGAKGADGFKGGPDFPFANRRHLLHYDNTLEFNPKTGIEAIFTSMTARYEKKDTDGNWQPSSFEACQGTWRECREITQCDHSVKVSYRFKSPDIIGKDPKAPWVNKIENIINNADKAITVKAVANPAALCLD